MAQRISRAKAAIKAAGARFGELESIDLADRIGAVRHVLYLVFNEGYVSSAGDRTQRGELTAEAIRLTRMLLAASADLPATLPETVGLLALMLLTDARSGARERAGELIPLAEQDRSLWDAGQISEGVSLIERTLGTGSVGPYQVQAAIAAVHDEAPTDEATDWPQILALYDVLERVAPGPVVTLNRAVALARVDGPRAGLALLGTLDDDARLEHSHRLDAVRAHLLELAGDPRRRAGGVPACSTSHRQRAGAALPGAPRGLAGRVVRRYAAAFACARSSNTSVLSRYAASTSSMTRSRSASSQPAVSSCSR